MKDEISAAVEFLAKLVLAKNETIASGKLDEFRSTLNVVLNNRFKNHWFPDKPSKGQAFRCIRVNENIPKDTLLESVCTTIGIKYSDLKMPLELTLWIDPHEVSCRFGEHKGSFCVVASFRDGNKENFVDQINIKELEEISRERSKQASFDMVKSRKKQLQRQLMMNGNNNMISNHHMMANGGMGGMTSGGGHHVSMSHHVPHGPQQQMYSHASHSNGLMSGGSSGLYSSIDYNNGLLTSSQAMQNGPNPYSSMSHNGLSGNHAGHNGHHAPANSGGGHYSAFMSNGSFGGHHVSSTNGSLTKFGHVFTPATSGHNNNSNGSAVSHGGIYSSHPMSGGSSYGSSHNNQQSHASHHHSISPTHHSSGMVNSGTPHGPVGNRGMGNNGGIGSNGGFRGINHNSGYHSPNGGSPFGKSYGIRSSGDRNSQSVSGSVSTSGASVTPVSSSSSGTNNNNSGSASPATGSSGNNNNNVNNNHHHQSSSSSQQHSPSSSTGSNSSNGTSSGGVQNDRYHWSSPKSIVKA